MNWITTNIRFPEDRYIELKMEAVRKRKSVAALIREKVFSEGKKSSQSRSAEKLLKELDKLAKKNAKQNPGISFSKKLIEMRYEQ